MAAPAMPATHQSECCLDCLPRLGKLPASNSSMRMAEARAYAYDNVRSQKCQRREPRTYTPSAGSRRADRMAPIADFRKYRQHRRSLSDNGVPSTTIACRPGSWARICFWPRPRAPFSHEVPHARGHRIDIDDDRDRGATICLVGARETETAEDFLHVVVPADVFCAGRSTMPCRLPRPSRLCRKASSIINRTAANWRLLLAIADAASYERRRARQLWQSPASSKLTRLL